MENKELSHCDNCTKEAEGFIYCNNENCPCHTTSQKEKEEIFKDMRRRLVSQFSDKQMGYGVLCDMALFIQRELDKSYQTGKQEGVKEMLGNIAKNEGWEESFKFYKNKYNL